MASRAELERLYQELLDRHGQAIARAFIDAIDDLRTAAEVQRVVDAIAAGNVQGALEALHLDPAAYGPLEDAIARTYGEGGQSALQALPKRTPDGTALVIRFHARNPRAEAWLRTHSADLVTHIIEEQRTAVRQTLIAGMEAGRNPRSVALDIVGRVNRLTGKREGGILGLTPSQETFVRSARAELASGDPEALRHYLTRNRRDRRFDRTVAKAIREEKPVPPEIARKAVDAYTRRLEALRGEMIGRTEALSALNAAQYEALRQAVENGALQASQVRRQWVSAGDARVRHSHRGLDGDVVGLDEAFVSPSGARLKFPGDPSAPASERVGCRCWVQVKVDWFANVS